MFIFILQKTNYFNQVFWPAANIFLSTIIAHPNQSSTFPTDAIHELPYATTIINTSTIEENSNANANPNSTTNTAANSENS